MSDRHPRTDAALDEALLDVSLEAARDAAALQRREAGTLEPSRWSEKGTSDFVTEIDRESERRILAGVKSRFPDHAILAEEGTGNAAASGSPGDGPEGPPILWIVDPLDGTTNWLHGYPEWAVSIATLDARGLRSGVVVNGATGEEFAAIRGRGATRDGAPIRVSAVSEPRLALLGTGFPFKKAELVPGYLRVLGRMLESTSGVRRAGAAALDLCDLACGRLDGFWEHWLMVWDVAAGALIVREAGGTFGALPGTDDVTLEGAIRGGRDIAAAFDGSAALPAEPAGGFLAANGRLREALGRLWADAAAGLR